MPSCITAALGLWVGYISPSAVAPPRRENLIKTHTLLNTCRGASTFKFSVIEAILQQIVS